MQVYGTRVFLKAPSVTDYPDFDTHLHADSLNASPHIHYKLVQERRELCERYKRKMKEGVMEMTSDSDGDERPKKRFRRTPSKHLFRKPSASPAVFDHQDSPTSSVEVLSEAPSSPVSTHSFSLRLSRPWAIP